MLTEKGLARVVVTAPPATTKKGTHIMKRILCISVAIALGILASSAIAGLDVSGDTYTTIAVQTSATNGTTDTAAVDVSGLKGGAKIIIFDSGDIGMVSTQQVVAVQHSTTGTSSWTSVTSPTFADISTNATVEAESVDTQTLHKYIRLRVTLDGTNTVQHYIGGVIVSPR